MEHVLWIGGPPGSGKATVATRLARRHGLRWYNADTRTWEHRDRALREGNPAAARREAMTPHERWVTSTPEDMLEMSLLAAQVRGYFARPWADGDAETNVREFICECGDPVCDASVALPVAASARPVIAAGHGSALRAAAVDQLESVAD